MKEGTRNLIVGLTAIAGLVVFAVIIILFGSVPQWITPSYKLAIHLDDATGVANGTRIRLNGIDIGYVDDVELKKPSYKGVIARCEIETKRLIPAHSIAIATAGLLGGAATINIRADPPPEGQEETFLVTDGTAEMTGKMSNLGDQITQVAQEVRAHRRGVHRRGPEGQHPPRGADPGGCRFGQGRG
jgi:ABC-type transporter Mla subunit MlaD